MSDIQGLLEREARAVPPPGGGFDDLLRRAGRRRRMRRIASGSLAAIVGLAGMALLVRSFGVGTRDNGIADGGGSNYQVSVIETEVEADPVTGNEILGKARIWHRVNWTSDTFPGWHRCTTTVFGTDGSVVGRDSGLLSSLADGNVASGVVSVSASPSSAEIVCDPERLDVGEPYAYAFRNVHVRSVLPLTVGFEAVWLGPAHPGVVACDVEVYGSGGDILGRTRTNLSAGTVSTGPIEIDFAPDEVQGDVYSADAGDLTARFECQPYVREETAEPTPDSGASEGPMPQVSVALLNGTARNGLAVHIAQYLGEAGFVVIDVGYAPIRIAHTMLYYRGADSREHAVELADRFFPEASIEPLDSYGGPVDTGADILVVLGSDVAG